MVKGLIIIGVPVVAWLLLWALVGVLKYDAFILAVAGASYLTGLIIGLNIGGIK